MIQKTWARNYAIALGAFMALACGAPAKLPVEAGMGVAPILPKPRSSLIPLVNVVDAKGWRDGETPEPRDGLKVKAAGGRQSART